MTFARLAAWRRTARGEGHALGWIERQQDGEWFADGQEILVAETTIGCRFSVELDARWETRWAIATTVSDEGVRLLELRVDEDRRWSSGAGPLPELDGCIDVDIAATPLTNTFPIRRYADLAVGEARVAPVAWVEVPSLRVKRVEQSYRRVGPVPGLPGAEAWEYGDPDHGAFRLTVDADGLVIDYEGFATRISSAPLA